MKSGRVKGGSIIPAVIGTGRQFRSNLAQPVYNASGRSVKGGSARKIIEITSDDLVQNGGQYKLMGGPAIPMQIVTDRAQKGGAAQVVYPVDMLGNYDPTFAGYIYKVLTADEDSGYDPSSLIQFLPQNELSGGVSIDYSGLGHNGAYTAVTLGQAGVPGMGMSSAGYDGATSFNNVHSAGLVAAFDGTKGSLLTWIKVSAAGVWIDGANRYVAKLTADANNLLFIRKTNTNNQIRWQYSAGGIAETVFLVTAGPTGYVPVGMTWDKAGVGLIAYYDGAITGVPQAIAGAWLGNLINTQTILGANDTSPALVWSGNEAPYLLYNTDLSPTAMQHISTL